MTTATLVRARAFAPGSVGNLGPGLDILGLAVGGAGDEVLVERVDAEGVIVRDAGHPDLPTRADRNTAALATAEVVRRAEASVRGLAVSVLKGLPLAGGQGGSAASAVAAAVATNRLLGDPLDRPTLLAACLAAEEAVAGRHADNVAPSLFGGAVLVRSLDPLDVVCLPVPAELRVVLAQPDQRLRTRDARAVLPREIPLELALGQAAQVAGIVAALAAGDYALLGRALEDRIAEPARASLLPGFAEAKAAALAAGALGASISGSGPTAFALTRGDEAARAVAAAMDAAYRRAGASPQVRVAQVDRQGAREIP
jgi:homoserine kinase